MSEQSYDEVYVDEEEACPILSIDQLLGAWKLGNLLNNWAESPASVTEEDLVGITALGEQFGINTTAALFRYQQEYKSEIDSLTDRVTKVAERGMDALQAIMEAQADAAFEPPLPKRNKPREAPAYPQPTPQAWSFMVVPTEQEIDSDPFTAWIAPEEMPKAGEIEPPVAKAPGRVRPYAETEHDRNMRMAAGEVGVDPGSFNGATRRDMPILPEHGLITHSPDYTPSEELGVVKVNVPHELINSSTETGQLPRVGE